MPSSKILVVDDDPHIVCLIRDNLEISGFNVVTAPDGFQGLNLFRQNRPDLVILDLMMPGISGFEVCEEMRRISPSVPILILTARSQLNDKVTGLELGGTDYITKPFELLELIARVKAAIRQSRGGQDPAWNTLEIGPLKIDIGGSQIFLKGERLDLSKTEFSLLKLLAQHAGRNLSREFILEQIWGYDYIGESRTIDNFIRNLREKIESDPAHPQLIKTVRGIGYRLESEGAAA